MRRNHLRELLAAGKPSIGTHIHNSWPTIIELIGHAGTFDYVEFLAEYAPYDLYTLDNMGRAIELFDNLTGIIKIEQQPRLYTAAKATQAGFQGVLFADVRTVADAEECVRAVRAETPATGGLHGVAMTRDVGIVLEGASPAFVQSLEDAVVAIMIEKKQALDNLEAILSIKGIDMVQFGPADMSLSMGLAGQRGHPAVREAEEYVIKTALKKGIAPRAEIGTPEMAERYLKMGVKHFCMGWDVRILYDWFKEKGGALRELVAQ
ncbi:MAG: aldolase/citrate lyase family protein [Bacteroidetes bacterium]|nr:aldolase/citrate lyase family protein [Bacteroidota bacterium]